MEISAPRTIDWAIARRNELWFEAALIALVSLFSAVLYVGRIGFYSDDWAFIGTLFQHAPDHSYLGLLWQFTDSNTIPRPVQLVYLVTLYYFFGLNPLGYHIVNMLSMAILGALFHLVVRELRFPARIALALSLIYVLLPHASANRFWYALFETNLSLLFFCLSVYADLRLLRARPSRRLAWHVLSVLALLLSTLAYELVIPLFALVPLLVWYQRRTLIKAGEANPSPRTPLVILLRNWLLLVAVMAFKIYTTNRIEQDFNLIGQIGWFANMQFDAFKLLILGPYGIRLPRMLIHIVVEQFNLMTLLVSIVAGVMVFGLLYWWPRRSDEPLPEMRHLLMLLGIAIFCIAAGYGIFITNRQAIITSTGINNRSSGAALFGIALFVVAGAGILARLLRNERRAQLAFALIIAIYSGSCFLALNTLGNLWAAANQEQHQIMAEVRARFPTLESGSSLILDGYCPYIGPGIVFEAKWDTSGMLRSMYDDPTVQGDMVNHRLEIHEDGIYTRMYLQHETRTPATEEAARNGQLRRLATTPYFIHPYGKLWIYNRKYNVVVPIPNPAAAHAYFDKYNPTKDSGCVRYRVGNGEAVW